MKKSIKIDQSKNGVRVIKTQFFNKKGHLIGSIIDADCGCYGLSRHHTSTQCPALKRRKERK